MAEPTYSIGLVVEAVVDARTATVLVDRCLQELVEWIEPEHLEHLRGWRGIEPDTELTLWKHTKLLARKHRISLLGFFDGDPGKEDSRAARRALLLFARLGMPDLVLLIRDADDKPERRQGLEQARLEIGDEREQDRVVIGVAEPEREAWVIGGFVPCDDRERHLVASERERLGFDPTLHPHELHGNGKRNAKTALSNLCGGDPQRERRCLTEPALSELRARGQRTGLAAFLDEVEERIVPVVSGIPRRPAN